MCGRFAEYTSADDLLEAYGAAEASEAARDRPPSYNVAPTDPVRIVIDRPADTDATPAADADGAGAGAGADEATADDARPRRELHLARWGLVPSWSRSLTTKGAPLFNARIETVAEKPAFRASLRARRCLVPADGYYEWRRNDRSDDAAVQAAVRAGTMPARTPFYITEASGSTLAFAGLYGWWRDPSRAEDDPERWVLSTTILTQPARDGLETIHDREPVVLARDAIGAWLDPRVRTADEALGVLAEPGPPLEWYEVGPRVGSVRNDDPGLIHRV